MLFYVPTYSSTARRREGETPTAVLPGSRLVRRRLFGLFMREIPRAIAHVQFMMLRPSRAFLRPRLLSLVAGDYDHLIIIIIIIIIIMTPIPQPLNSAGRCVRTHRVHNKGDGAILEIVLNQNFSTT